jgi:hypothetical protein
MQGWGSSYSFCMIQVKGIPFLAFDAGGVLEMFDAKEFEDNVVFEPTLAALKRKLAHVVERGRIKTVQLAEHITTGRQQWLQWHADFADNLPVLIQVPTPDILPPILPYLSARVLCNNRGAVQAVHISGLLWVFGFSMSIPYSGLWYIDDTMLAF